MLWWHCDDDRRAIELEIAAESLEEKESRLEGFYVVKRDNF